MDSGMITGQNYIILAINEDSNDGGCQQFWQITNYQMLFLTIRYNIWRTNNSANGS